MKSRHVIKSVDVDSTIESQRQQEFKPYKQNLKPEICLLIDT